MGESLCSMPPNLHRRSSHGGRGELWGEINKSYLEALMRDYTYEDTWTVRDKVLSVLGMDYEEYLKSGHWAKMRKKASLRQNYQSCECCGGIQDIQLHHSTYKWLGDDRNELRSVNSFCKKHHNKIHEIAATCQISVRLATNYIRNKENEITRKNILKYGNSHAARLYT
jgi:hypothetical protein